MALKPGVVVKQLVAPVQGAIKDIRWEPSSEQFMVLVGYEVGGVDHERWFLESQVVEVPADPKAAEGAK